jgi:hypothetical protein
MNTVIARADDKLWGVGLHLGGDKQNLDETEQALLELGVSSFRDEFWWQHVETKHAEMAVPEGKRVLQQFIADGPARGMKGLLALTYGNPLYFEGLPKTDADRAAFARYAVWAARTFGRSLAGVEVWNEWNIGGGSEPRETGTAAEYIKLLKSVRGALRPVAPGLPVLAGAMSGQALDWVRSFGEQGGFAFCDGFSTHPYNHHDSDASAEDVVLALDDLHREIKKHTKKSMPIYVTEIGWPNHDGVGGSTEAVSAQRLLKTNLLLATRGYLRGMWWYDLRDDGTNLGEQEHNFGLMHTDWKHKPAFEAYKLFLTHFKRARFVKQQPAQGVTSLEFKRPDGRRVAAVWAHEGRSDERLSVHGSYKIIPIPGADSERISSELKKGSALLAAWPALIDLAPEAQVQVSAPSHAGCGY